MNPARIPLALLLAALCTSPGYAASYRNGVVDDGPPPSDPALAVAPLRPALAISVNFDDVTAPCIFLSTTALRNQYAGAGVTFSGPAPNDGGAILNECGTFSISGFSPPNFVAFNNVDALAHLSDGGIAVAPERMDFSTAVSSVEVNVGGAQGGSATLTAYSAADVQLASTSVVLANSMQTLSLNAPGIRYAVLSVQDTGIWIFDDLSFDLASTPARASTWGRLKTAYR